jgi:hypothetical protein
MIPRKGPWSAGPCEQRNQCASFRSGDNRKEAHLFRESEHVLIEKLEQLS